MLVAAAVLGAAALARRGPDLARALAPPRSSVALAANYCLGAIPLWRDFPGGEQLAGDARRT